MERFAREDERVKRHLDVVRRKELLEHVLKEMEGLRALEGRVAGGVGGGRTRDHASGRRERKGWGW